MTLFMCCRLSPVATWSSSCACIVQCLWDKVQENQSAGNWRAEGFEKGCTGSETAAGHQASQSQCSGLVYCLKAGCVLPALYNGGNSCIHRPQLPKWLCVITSKASWGSLQDALSGPVESGQGIAQQIFVHCIISVFLTLDHLLSFVLQSGCMLV